MPSANHTYSAHARVQVTERLLIAGLRAHERADESEAQRERLAFLFKASLQLALSLEPATVLQTTLDLLVPTLADAATLSIVPLEQGRMRTTSATSELLDDRTAEWWNWIDRATRTAIKRATSTGTTDLGDAAPRTARVVPINGPQVSYLVVPLRARGRSLGALRLLGVPPRRKFRQDDVGLLEAFASRASLALENALLFEKQRSLVAHLEEMHGKLDAAQSESLLDDERRRIARDLHDNVEQTLFAIGLTAAVILEPSQGESSASDLNEALRRIWLLAISGAEQLRGAIFALKHTEYSAFGLVARLRTLARSFQARTSVETDLIVSGPESNLPTQAIETLYAVAREALANVERHACASSAVLRLQMRARSLILTVHDDGAGGPRVTFARGGTSAIHFGLAGLHERVRAMNGTFSAGPGPGGGFMLRVRLPLSAAART